ncbi:hypothetical protein ABEB36_002433 [Hypothenemus hampei]|uniref:Uncharacterized protein n=1 Tax=Hypothenemus hampei TaxID=57062 RepID=A0ABD1F5Q7_HYPHA
MTSRQVPLKKRKTGDQQFEEYFGDVAVYTGKCCKIVFKLLKDQQNSSNSFNTSTPVNEPSHSSNNQNLSQINVIENILISSADTSSNEVNKSVPPIENSDISNQISATKNLPKKRKKKTYFLTGPPKYKRKSVSQKIDAKNQDKKNNETKKTNKKDVEVVKPKPKKTKSTVNTDKSLKPKKKNSDESESEDEIKNYRSNDNNQNMNTRQGQRKTKKDTESKAEKLAQRRNSPKNKKKSPLKKLYNEDKWINSAEFEESLQSD